MKYLAVLVFFVSLCHAQPKYWELQQGELEKIVRESDLIVIGTVSQHNKSQLHIKIAEVLQGPQRLSRILCNMKPAMEDEIKDIDTSREYLCFLKQENDYERFSLFSPRSVLKNDLFLAGRVRKEVMKWKVERSDYIASGIVNSIKQTLTDKGDFNVIAQCTLQKNFKGELPATFEIEYVHAPKAYPIPSYLFENIDYVFFLKKLPGQEAYSMMNLYEGAYPQRLYFLKDIKLVTGVENRFDEVAGQTVKGIRVFARLQNETVKKDESIIINVLLQNDSDKEIEIYQNQASYFILFHIIDDDGKILATKYPKKNSVPALQANYFMKLASKQYFFLPSFNLQEYCLLKEGKYSIYVEYDLPWEYSGKTIGKSAWTGKALSNKIEINISE